MLLGLSTATRPVTRVSAVAITIAITASSIVSGRRWDSSPHTDRPSIIELPKFNVTTLWR